jgi:hypothetical protein
MHKIIEDVEVIARRSDLSIADRIDRLLVLGRPYLDTEIGVVAQVRSNTYTISRLAAKDVPYRNGQSHPL